MNKQSNTAQWTITIAAALTGGMLVLAVGTILALDAYTSENPEQTVVPQAPEVYEAVSDGDVVQVTHYKVGREQNTFEMVVAKSNDAQLEGLMNTTTIPQDGMLFVYDSQQFRTFWMKDTFVSLDIIFLDNDGFAVTVHDDTAPNQIETRYPSTAPAQYVLEFPATYSEEFRFREGDQFVFKF